MLRQQKHDIIEKMKSDFARAQAVLFLDFTGLTVAEANGLRIKLRAAQVGYRVAKNTLVKQAIAGTAYEGAGKWLKGTPTGVVFGFEDPVTPARLTYEFLKDCQHLKVKGGVLDAKAIGPQEVEALSKMPSRPEMQAQVVGMILGVGGALASQLKFAAGRIVGAIEAKVKKDEAA